MQRTILIFLLLLGGCATLPDTVSVNQFRPGQRIASVSILGNDIKYYVPGSTDAMQYESASVWRVDTKHEFNKLRTPRGFNVDPLVEGVADYAFARDTPLKPVRIDYDSKQLDAIYTGRIVGKPDDPGRVSAYVNQLMAKNSLDYLVLFVRLSGINFIDNQDPKTLDTLGCYAASGSQPAIYFLMSHVFVFKRGESAPIAERFLRNARATLLKGDDLIPSRKKIEGYDLNGVPLRLFLVASINHDVDEMLEGPGLSQTP